MVFKLGSNPNGWSHSDLWLTVITLCFRTLKNNYFGEKYGVFESKGCPKNMFSDAKNKCKIGGVRKQRVITVIMTKIYQKVVSREADNVFDWLEVVSRVKAVFQQRNSRWQPDHTLSTVRPKSTSNYYLWPCPPDFCNFLYMIKTWSCVWLGRLSTILWSIPVIYIDADICVCSLNSLHLSPQIMKVKLQPPSATDLPAFNPILPPSAISQVLLLANPQQVIHRSMDSSTNCQAPPQAAYFLWSCDKVYHKQEVCFLLYILGQIVSWQYNPNLLD